MLGQALLIVAPMLLGADQYTQSVKSYGVVIKAPAAVDPAALAKGAAVVAQMLQRARPDIRQRLVNQRAALAIIPKREFVTALPEFAWLSGKTDANGNAYDSFAIRGLGAVPGQPTTATSEENLLKLPGDPFWAESVAHHEFGHAVMNLGFTATDRQNWAAIYARARQRNTFPGAFAMVNADEYWAELTQSYFGVNNEINGRAIIQARDPDAFLFLQGVYGR